MSHSLKRKLSYSDLPEWSGDGKRYELIRGELFVNPSPNRVHQRVSFRLQQQLAAYFHSRGLGEVLAAPTDLILTGQDVFVPDLVVASLDDTSQRGIEQAPLLVVEILSPSTSRLDRKLKFSRYAELGVPHYWIVDAVKRRIECFKLEGEIFASVFVAQGDSRFVSSEFEGLTIDLESLWLPPPTPQAS